MTELINPAHLEMSYSSDDKDGMFDKSDRVGIFAALIDAAIIGIGITIGLVWQSGTSTKPVNTGSALPQALSSASSTGKPVMASTPVVPVARQVTVCEALVTTKLSNGSTRPVEYRGSCPAIRAIAKQSRLPVKWLPQRTYQVPGSSPSN